MQSKLFDNKIVVRVDPDEEIITTLQDVCEANNVTLGVVFGVGGVNEITLAVYDHDDARYATKKFSGYYEISSLQGNVSVVDDEPYINVYATIVDNEFKSYSGRLVSGYVAVTCEVIIGVINGVMNREVQQETGVEIVSLV